MDSSPSASTNQSGSTSRGRGRGNRGGLGKYLRARGRRGSGRPAEWKQRALLEGEGPDDEDDEEAREAREEMARKYAKRGLGSNANRYAEEEPELDSEGECLFARTDLDAKYLIAHCYGIGEEIKEPEVDLSNFLARQRLDDAISPSIPNPAAEPDEDEVDHSLTHLKFVGAQSAHKPVKGRVQTIDWDEELENMSREKAAAEANRGERKIDLCVVLTNG